MATESMFEKCQKLPKTMKTSKTRNDIENISLYHSRKSALTSLWAKAPGPGPDQTCDVSVEDKFQAYLVRDTNLRIDVFEPLFDVIKYFVSLFASSYPKPQENCEKLIFHPDNFVETSSWGGKNKT